MTVDEIRRRTRYIRALAADPEAAHAEEARLYTDLLAAIAGECCDDAAGCAREALKTADINFPRWCA